MPYRSLAQQRYLESKDSPLTEDQKKEYRAATDFSKLPEHVASTKRGPPAKKIKNSWTGR